MDYLTVKEVAELKGCSERYVKTLCKNENFQAIQELNSKGRPKYLIPVSALSEDLQLKYYKKQRTGAGLLPKPKRKSRRDHSVPLKNCLLMSVRKSGSGRKF